MAGPRNVQLRRFVANTGATPATVTIPLPGVGYRVRLVYVQCETEGGTNIGFKLTVVDNLGNTSQGRLILVSGVVASGSAISNDMNLGSEGYPFGENIAVKFTLDAAGASSLTISGAYFIEPIFGSFSGGPPDL